MGAERILLVDDEQNARSALRCLLTDEGYEVFEASNGVDALEMLPDCQPDLILLDLRMPVMDGWEFARRYRLGPGPHVPIVAFIAALNAQLECADLEATSILPKPFDLDDLLAIVRDLVPVPR